MKLYWCKYGDKYKLVIPLGTSEGKLYCLQDTDLSKPVKQIIRSSAIILDGLSLKERINWLKNNCPAAMAGFRTLHENKLMVYKKYTINEQEMKKE